MKNYKMRVNIMNKMKIYFNKIYGISNNRKFNLNNRLNLFIKYNISRVLAF